MKWIQKNWFVLTLVALASLTGIFIFGDQLQYLWRSIFSPNRESDNMPEPGGSPSSGTSDFPLKKGSRGDLVKSLQRFLNASGSYGLVVDGIFGDKTDAAVYSELNGLADISDPHQVPQWYFNSFIKGQY